jgi:acyl-CoA dehydrogenase family member 9
LQEISRVDRSTALTVGAHSSIGLKALLLFGNKSQKEHYLPKLATGEYIAAFCLTEAEAGSDAASIKTSAQKQADGTWILNGEKIWITNGPIAQFFTVFARTGEPGAKGISAFIVERNLPGVSVGKKEEKLGIKASATSTVAFTNVILSAESLIGNEGEGFKIAVNVLNNGRSGLGGGCVGAMKQCIDLASSYASERKQFGSSIAEFELIKEKIARMTALCFMSESIVELVGEFIDSGKEDYALEAAASKIFTTDALITCSYEALQIAGGNGFMKEYPYEMIVRDCRINTIFEGTNEVLRLFIGLTGFQELGFKLSAFTSSFKGFKDKPKDAFNSLKEYAQLKLSPFLPVTQASNTNFSDFIAKAYFEISKLTFFHASQAESYARKYGKKLKDKQIIAKSFADSAIWIFCSLAALSRIQSLYEIAKSAEEKTTLEELCKLITTMTKVEVYKSLQNPFLASSSSIHSVADAIIKEKRYLWDSYLD